MLRFLALGDSYTIGEGVEAAERWPNQLLARLRSHGYADAELQIIARTAWTTDELLDAIDAERPAGPFSLVSLMIGVNDQYRSRPAAGFAEEFQRLLRRAIGFAGRKPHRVIAISIPDWGATPYAASRDRARISAEIAEYNQRAESLAAAARVPWVSVTELSRAMQHDGALVCSDGLHPTGAMYQRWADAILPAALTALGAVRARRTGVARGPLPRQ